MLSDRFFIAGDFPAWQIRNPAGLRRSLVGGLLLLGLVICPVAVKAETTIEWNGFASVGGGKLDDDSINRQNVLPHNEFSDETEFEPDTRVAMQASAWFDNDFNLSIQAISDGADDFDPALEWAYIGYDANDNLKLRFGRMRRPLYTYSDYLHVGYAYPWIRPPVEVYSRDLRYYDGVDALDLFYQAPVADWNFSLQAYYGKSSGEAEVADGVEVDFRTADDSGIVLSLDRDWLTLRFGYHKSPSADVGHSDDLSQLIGGLDGAGFESVGDELRTEDIDVDFYNLGLSVDSHEWIGGFEYINMRIDTGLGAEEHSWYLMAGRRIGPYTIHITYAERERENDRNLSAPIYTQIDQLTPLAGDPNIAAAIQGLSALAGGVDQAIDETNLEQHSYTLGLRYNFDSPASVKIEYQRIFDDRLGLNNNLLSFVFDFLI